jgi:hypothetical protein
LFAQKYKGLAYQAGLTYLIGTGPIISLTGSGGTACRYLKNLLIFYLPYTF